MTTQEPALGLLEPGDPDYDNSTTGVEGEGTAAAERGTVVVIVFAPKEPNPKRFRFRLEETVGEAAKVAAEKFGYEVGTPSFQKSDGTVLDRNITLRAAGIHDRQELELVDVGGGV